MGSNKTLNTLDGNQSSQATILTGVDNTKNPSTHQGTSRSGNTSFTQYQNNSRIQVNAISNLSGQNNNINGQIQPQQQKRGESSNSSYKDRYQKNIRPKSSSTHAGSAQFQNTKVITTQKKGLSQANQQSQEMKKKGNYNDYLEKYNENYFNELDKCQSENGDSPKRKKKGDEEEFIEIGKNPIEMEYSEDSIGDQEEIEEDYHFQDEEQLMKNIEDIENEQNQSSTPMSFANPINELEQKSVDNVHTEHQNNRYTKSKSALTCSLTANEQDSMNMDNNRSSHKQVDSVSGSNLQFNNLTQRESQTKANNNEPAVNVNQSFAVQKSQCLLFKEKPKRNQNDASEMPQQDTAHFKDLNFLSSSTSKLQKKNKEFKNEESGNSLRNSKQNNLTIRQPRFSLSVDEEEKKEITKNESEVSTKSPTNFNIVIPGKKGLGEITEEYIKANSPQFCQTQIATIKQQLSMQTTYLQIQQKQLDEKLVSQQQELQKQLQHNQITQQQMIKTDHNQMKNTLMEQNKSENNLFAENGSHSQQIQEIQEEDEEEGSIYKGSAQKKKNKIQQIQLRQLKKEKLIQNSKDSSFQKVFVAEEIDYKFEDIAVNQKLANNQKIDALNQSSQSYQDSCLRRVDFTKKEKKDEEVDKPLKDHNVPNNQITSSKSPEIILQPSNNQIKKRIKILSCHQVNHPETASKQKTLKDISNLHKNKLNESHSIETIERCITDQQHERPRTGKKKLLDNRIKQQDIIHQNHLFKTLDQESNLQEQLQTPSPLKTAENMDRPKALKEINHKKPSLEPLVPKIAAGLQQQKMTTDTPTSNFRNHPPLSASSKRSRTHDYTNSSPINSQFQQSPQPKVFLNESNQLQRAQFKITKKKEVSQSFRDQFGDSMKELSTEIYINNNNTNSKKSEQLTPFWGDENNQKLKQSFVKEKSEENERKDIKGKYSFYTETIDAETIQLSDIPNQNIIISNIVNCPLNPSYLSKLTKQLKQTKKEDTISPKVNGRPQTSHGNQSYNNYKQSNENVNTSILTQIQPKVYYQPSSSNSPISAISGSTTNKNQQFRPKSSHKNSYFKF